MSLYCFNCYIFFIVIEYTSNFIGNSKTIYFYNNFSRNCLLYSMNTPRRLSLNSISSKECNEPTPVWWCWILKELQTIRLENHSGAKYKIFTSYIAVTFWIFNILIFPFDAFQPHHPPVIPTIHMVLFINYSLGTLWAKFHHGHFTSCNASFKSLGPNELWAVFPGTFHFLEKPVSPLWLFYQYKAYQDDYRNRP